MLYPPERLTGTPLRPPQIGGGFTQGGANGAKELLTNPLLQQDIPPLTCRLYRGEAGARKVVVTDGAVIEVLQAVGDSPIEHPVSGTRDISFPNLYKEHNISAAAPVVGVEFTVDKAGKITNTPSIAVYSVAASESLHYIPAVGPDAGQSGYCFYALAKLTGSGDDDYLEVLHAGSNIDYVPDLATFKLVNGAVGKDIFKAFNQTLGQYEYRGLAGEYGSPLEVTYDEAGTDILVKWVNAKNLDFTVKSYRLEARPDLEIPITLTVSEKSITIPPSGAHQHSFSDTQIGGSNMGIFGMTGLDTSSTSEPPPDGEHGHTFTIPAETLSTTIQVPQAPVTVANSSYYTLCWRTGLYAGIFLDGAPTPMVAEGQALDSKTIWVLDRSTQVDYSETPTAQTFPIILL